MRKAFFEYNRPTDQEFDDLWRTCIFSFDASVLLDLYRYSEESRDELLKLMTVNKKRIWVTHQVALEFQRNRISVIFNAHSRAEKITKSLKSLLNQLKQERQHPYITATISEEIATHIEASTTLVEGAQRSYPDLLVDDKIGEQILDLLEGRVGTAFPSEELIKLRDDIERRYDEKIPPGYLDRKDKDTVGSHGDCIIWFQLMDYAKKNKKSIIYVTRDTKEDWWVEFEGKTIYPRPELRREFLEKTGQQIYLYKAEQFIQYANQNPQTATSSKLLQETKVISRDAENSPRKISNVDQSSASNTQDFRRRLVERLSQSSTTSASEAMRRMQELSELPSMREASEAMRRMQEVPELSSMREAAEAARRLQELSESSSMREAAEAMRRMQELSESSLLRDTLRSGMLNSSNDDFKKS